MFLLLLPLLSLLSPVSPAVENWIREIHDAQNLIRRQQTTSVPYKKVCYPDLGCFTTDGPMKHTGRLPQSPGVIQTQFFAFNAGQKNYKLVDPYKPATFSVIKPEKRLVLLVNGYGVGGNQGALFTLKDTVLEYSKGEVGTLVSVHWVGGAPTGSAERYIQAAVNTQLVARQVAFFLKQLSQHYAFPPSRVYCLGYSLGGQLCGQIGKATQSQFGFTIDRITSLDPVAILFESYPNASIARSDATFVDIIHTSVGPNILAGDIGVVAPAGHLDFYLNGGHDQPFCVATKRSPACHHRMSVFYYEESLKGQCTFTGYSPGGGRSRFSRPAKMGYYADKDRTVRGVRFVKVTAVKPYCQG